MKSRKSHLYRAVLTATVAIVHNNFDYYLWEIARKQSMEESEDVDQKTHSWALQE